MKGNDISPEDLLNCVIFSEKFKYIMNNWKPNIGLNDNLSYDNMAEGSHN